MKINSNNEIGGAVSAPVNNETVAAPVATRKPGRPIVPTATRELRLDANGKAFMRGAPKVGETYTYVTVHRKITAGNYVHGTSPVVSIEQRMTPKRTYKPKEAAPVVAVNVIAPSTTGETVAMAVESPAPVAEVNPLIS